MDGGPQNIDEITKNFCQKVIDNTIEQLRAQMVSNEIPEDGLDRLKSQWEQRWKNNLLTLEEEAKEKKNARNNIANQLNQQQNQEHL